MKELGKGKGLKTKLRFLCKNGVQTVAAPKIIGKVRMSDLKNRPREIETTNKYDRTKIYMYFSPNNTYHQFET